MGLSTCRRRRPWLRPAIHVQVQARGTVGGRIRIRSSGPSCPRETAGSVTQLVLTYGYLATATVTATRSCWDRRAPPELTSRASNPALPADVAWTRDSGAKRSATM